ncbi:DUF1080 domain-containing protein [Echinicola sp. CAU 1574]|uniref:DUF1080 domain-containing protein n=1 Tax=Echinicola arenosa TaxID=2774144 RepID=A0ABR9APC2_9BACT|nr:DUF1080 domain-containing protein [Echinicola arenosa]MBD8490627.1 DUF1080 domain-containing protein [Echinicola arenosa]
MKLNLLIPIVAGSLLSIPALAQHKQIQLPPEATEVWEPEPRKVTPGEENHLPPSDAIVLFDGSDLSAWKSYKTGGDAEWSVHDGIFTVAAGKGDIATKESFGDVQVHIEWKAPDVVKGDGQGRGNSGLFFMDRYEVQILDSYDNRTYSNGQAASLYKEGIPLVNATRPHTEWNTYDVFFTAPRFNEDGMLIRPAYVTVIHNGILVQNHYEVKGSTAYIGVHQYEPHEAELPIKLQDHGNPVNFRNIWVRKL